MGMDLSHVVQAKLSWAHREHLVGDTQYRVAGGGYEGPCPPAYIGDGDADNAREHCGEKSTRAELCPAIDQGAVVAPSQSMATVPHCTTRSFSISDVITPIVAIGISEITLVYLGGQARILHSTARKLRCADSPWKAGE